VRRCNLLARGEMASRGGLEVRESLIPGAGRGLFTTAAVVAGAVVCGYTGQVLRTADAVRLTHKDYLMRLGPQVYIDSGPEEHHGVLARYINDSRYAEHVGIDRGVWVWGWLWVWGVAVWVWVWVWVGCGLWGCGPAGKMRVDHTCATT
jgi:hypothetical protein